MNHPAGASLLNRALPSRSWTYVPRFTLPLAATIAWLSIQVDTAALAEPEREDSSGGHRAAPVSSGSGEDAGTGDAHVWDAQGDSGRASETQLHEDVVPAEAPRPGTQASPLVTEPEPETEPEEPDTARKLGTVTVTAQKREESAQDVPSAVTAIPGKKLVESGGGQPAGAVLQLVPNASGSNNDGWRPVCGLLGVSGVSGEVREVGADGPAGAGTGADAGGTALAAGFLRGRPGPRLGTALAGDVAPGLLRTRWGFERWLGHDEAVYLPTATMGNQIALASVRKKSRTVLRVIEDHQGPLDPALFAPETFVKAAAAPPKNP